MIIVSTRYFLCWALTSNANSQDAHPTIWGWPIAFTIACGWP
jgi:hypothetical protein